MRTEIKLNRKYINHLFDTKPFNKIYDKLSKLFNKFLLYFIDM